MQSQTQVVRDTILAVDDEPQVLVALEDLLSDDLLVLKSDSAERALRLVEQQPDIAVVVSDQRMPRMHGDELFKRLRARYSAERILATGYADLNAVIRAVNDVLRMTDDPQEMSIVTTIISLAHALDLKVIAEGVETALQAQLLRLLKCDQVRGYSVAKPQVAEDVEALLSMTFDLGRRSA